MIGNEKKCIAINFMLGQECPNVKTKLTLFRYVYGENGRTNS